MTSSRIQNHSSYGKCPKSFLFFPPFSSSSPVKRIAMAPTFTIPVFIPSEHGAIFTFSVVTSPGHNGEVRFKWMILLIHTCVEGVPEE